MACTFELFIADQPAAYAEQVAQTAFAEVDRLERELSRFIDHSDIARINRLSAGESLRLGPDAFDCLVLAARVHADTGGAFDVTVGALVEAVRRRQSTEQTGANASTTAAACACGMHLLRMDRPTHSVTALVNGLIVDLGAIGKGYTIDRVVELLRDWGVGTALAHCGQSTCYALGAPPGHDGWPVAIRNPLDHAATLGRVTLREAALSGSGALLHGPHIIDPRTGRPAAIAAGAWAMAPSAALSDAISTACMVMSASEIEAYCRAHSEVGALAGRQTDHGFELQPFGTWPVVHSA